MIGLKIGLKTGAVVTVALAAIGAARCAAPPRETLRLEGNLLTVDNQSAEDWNDVEIYLNTYFRITASKIPSGSRFQAPLDVFVAGFGQRFDVHRMPIRSLKLTAKRPDGRPMEVVKQFQLSGLAGALGGKK
jgi:hypothetical protein